MKPGILFLAVFYFSQYTAFAQISSTDETRLLESYRKIAYWNDKYYKNSSEIGYYDSIRKANNSFGKDLLKVTSTNTNSIYYNFRLLTSEGVNVVTSEDGQFRIYTWDTQTGGTMHFFWNVFQFNNAGKIYSELINNSNSVEEPTSGSFYNHINDIHRDSSTYYITQRVSVLSSALFTYNIDFYTIKDSILSTDAYILKTKEGFSNNVGYEIDLNRDKSNQQDMPDYKIHYDPSKKQISIPVILQSGAITNKRIIYQFNGRYFEKIDLK